MIDCSPLEPLAGREAATADYCGACGAKAPHLPLCDAAARVTELRRHGWLCLASRSLHREIWLRAIRNCLCPDCLRHPTPFARKLLSAWGLPS